MTVYNSEAAGVKILLNMKKFLTFVIVLAMAVSVAACKKASPAGGANTPTNQAVDAQGTKQIEYTIQGQIITFKVNRSLPLETDSWIGFCSKGSYIYEDNADDACIVYAYYEELENETDDYTFLLSSEGIEDGEYTMVLCNTDNSGYVIGSWSITIKEGLPTVDLSGFKVNSKPEGMPPPQDPADNVDDDEAPDDDEFFDSEEDDSDEPDGTGDDGDDEPGETDSEDDEDESDEGADDA